MMSKKTIKESKRDRNEEKDEDGKEMRKNISKEWKRD